MDRMIQCGTWRCVYAVYAARGGGYNDFRHGVVRMQYEARFGGYNAFRAMAKKREGGLPAASTRRERIGLPILLGVLLQGTP